MANMYRIVCGLNILLALLGAFNSVRATHVYDMSLVNMTYGVLSNELEFNMTVSQEGLMTINACVYKKSSDFYVQVVVAFDDGSGKYSNTMLNKTIEICKFLSTPTYETLLQLYYKALLKHENNFPISCPFGGDAYYFMRNVGMAAMPVPPYVPGSNAYIYMNYMIKENDQFRSLATGKIFMNFKNF